LKLSLFVIFLILTIGCSGQEDNAYQASCSVAITIDQATYSVITLHCLPDKPIPTSDNYSYDDRDIVDHIKQLNSKYSPKTIGIIPSKEYNKEYLEVVRNSGIVNIKISPLTVTATTYKYVGEN